MADSKKPPASPPDFRGDHIPPALKQNIMEAYKMAQDEGISVDHPEFARLVEDLYEEAGESTEGVAMSWLKNVVATADWGPGALRTAIGTAVDPIVPGNIVQEGEMTDALKGPIGDARGAVTTETMMERAGVPELGQLKNLTPFPEAWPEFLNVTGRGAIGAIADGVVSPGAGARKIVGAGKAAVKGANALLTKMGVKEAAEAATAAELRKLQHQQIMDYIRKQNELQSSLKARIGERLKETGKFAVDPLDYVGQASSKRALKSNFSRLDEATHSNRGVYHDPTIEHLDDDPRRTKVSDRAFSQGVTGTARSQEDRLNWMSRERGKEMIQIGDEAAAAGVKIPAKLSTQRAVDKAAEMLGSTVPSEREAARRWLLGLEPHFYQDVRQGLEASAYWKKYLSDASKMPEADLKFLGDLNEKLKFSNNMDSTIPFEASERRLREAQGEARKSGQYGQAPTTQNEGTLWAETAAGYKEALENSLDRMRRGAGGEYKLASEEVGALKDSVEPAAAASGRSVRVGTPGETASYSIKGILGTPWAKTLMGAQYNRPTGAINTLGLGPLKDHREEYTKQPENQLPWRLLPSEVIEQELLKKEKK